MICLSLNSASVEVKFVLLDLGQSRQAILKVEKIEEPDEKTIVIYFHAQGYDLNLRLEKKEEDKVTGSLMGMFDAKGERVKSEAKTK